MNLEVSSSSSAASVALAIRNLTPKSIEPSGTPVQERRRTHYDAAALKELAENIKAVQVIEPISCGQRSVAKTRSDLKSSPASGAGVPAAMPDSTRSQPS